MTGSLIKLNLVSSLALFIGVVSTIEEVALFKSLSLDQESPALTQSEVIAEAADSDGAAEDTERDQSIGSVPKASEIEQILNTAAGFERSLILNGLLVDADIQALGVLLDQSEHLNSASFKRELQGVIVRLLASIDPTFTLTRINTLRDTSKNLLIAAVFEEWSILDLDAAVKSAQGLGDSDRAAALDGIFRSRIDLSHRQIVEIGKSMAATEDVEQVVAQKLIEATVHDPEELWRLLMDSYGNDVNTLSDTQVKLLTHAASAYFDRAGLQAIQDIAKSMANAESRIVVLGELFAGISHNDPETAFNLADQINDLDREVVEGMVRKWAQTEPLNALTAAIEAGEERGRLQWVAIETWASTNPISLYQSLDRVPKLLRAWARNQAIFSMAEVAPDLAIDALEDISDIGLKKSVARHLADEWPTQDLGAAFDWSKSNGKISIEMRSEMQQVILERMAHLDPEGAMKLALDQEIADSETGLEVAVIAGVSKISVDVALDMLEKARNQVTREKAYSSIGLALVRKGRYAKAIELVQEASTQIQREYYEAIAYTWARSDLESLIKNMESLPDDWIVRDIVGGAIGIYQW